MNNQLRNNVYPNGDGGKDSEITRHSYHFGWGIYNIVLKELLMEEKIMMLKGE